MSSNEWKFKNEQDLIAVANAILSGTINILYGIRKICFLKNHVRITDESIFLAICDIDSETDHYPLGDIRENFDPNYLDKLDKELNSYLKDEKDVIFSSCKKIIDHFSKN